MTIESFLEEVAGYLRKHWRAWELPGSPDTLTYEFRPLPRGRAPDRSRQLAFWRTSPLSSPRVVTKWALSPSFAPFVTQEHRHAAYLYEERGCRFLPRPFGCPEFQGIPVLVEQAIPGRLLSDLFARVFPTSVEARTLYDRAFSAALTVLRGVQDPLLAVSLDQVLSELSPFLERAALVLGWDPAWGDRVEAFLRIGIPDPVPGSGRTLLIGDFAPQNLLEGGGGKVHLIDLEFSRESVMAFLDPLSFAFQLFRITAKPSPLRDPEGAVQSVREHLLSPGSPLAREAETFLFIRGLPSSRPWHWLVYFLHETAFQHFLCETFPENLRTFFDGAIRMVMEELGH